MSFCIQNMGHWLSAIFLTLSLVGPVSAQIDYQSSATCGEIVNPRTPEGFGINRCDKVLTFRLPNNSTGFDSLLNALPSGRKAVEQGDASDLTATTRPGTDNSNSLATTSFVQSILKGVVYVAPSLTDTTCAGDQTSNVMTAAAFMPGYRLVFPSGCILLDGSLVNTSQNWEGAGEGRSGGTEIRYTPSSGTALKLMGPGARASGFRFTTTASNSTATAIQLSDGIENPRGQRVEHVSATGFQDQLSVWSGELWSLDKADFYNAIRYGVRIRNLKDPDSGDGVIANSNIYADGPIGDTAIRYESGGGLKVTTTKTLQFNHSFVLAIVDDANTSILNIDSSNSFENPRGGSAVVLGRIEGGTTGSFRNITVTAQVTGAVTTAPGVRNVRLAPVTSGVPYGVILQGGDGILVAGAAFSDVVHAVIVQDPTTNVVVGDYACSACTYRFEDQRSVGAGPARLDDVRPVAIDPNTTKLLWQVGIPPYRSAKIEVFIEGQLNGVYVIGNLRQVIAANIGSTIATPTVIANAEVTATVEPAFDIQTTPGMIGIGLTNSDMTHGFTGSMSVRIDGRTQTYRSLP